MLYTKHNLRLEMKGRAISHFHKLQTNWIGISYTSNWFWDCERLCNTEHSWGLCFPPRVPQNIVRGSVTNRGKMHKLFKIPWKFWNIRSKYLKNFFFFFIWRLAVLGWFLFTTKYLFVFLPVNVFLGRGSWVYEKLF